MTYLTMQIIALVCIILCGLALIFFIEEIVRFCVIKNRKRRFYYTLYTTDRKPVLLVNQTNHVKQIEQRPRQLIQAPKQTVTTKKVVKKKTNTTTNSRPTTTQTVNRTQRTVQNRSNMGNVSVNRHTNNYPKRRVK